MLTGRRFKLTERILGTEVLDGERKAFSLPVGAIIEVATDSAEGDKTLHILWGDKKLAIFVCDLEMRGTEIIGSQSQGLNDMVRSKRQGWSGGVA